MVARWPHSAKDPLLGAIEHGVHARKYRAGSEFSLGRWNMVDRSPYVSRVQCQVRVQDDGTALLVSKGKAATMWRPQGNGPWIEMQTGDTVVLLSLIHI